VAERWLSDDNWANLRNWAGHPDTDEVIAELEASGSLTPALNWYRANVAPETLLRPRTSAPVQAPTLGVWSERDLALTEAQMTGSERYVLGPWRYERIDGAGHWMQLEVPDRVNGLLVDFLPS
jgi:pimeloyl-ACP methyl ester carboxylesterase